MQDNLLPQVRQKTIKGVIVVLRSTTLYKTPVAPTTAKQKLARQAFLCFSYAETSIFLTTK
jgi:hypothetical protein